MPLKADLDQAWRDFNGWRVNYDEVLVRLCALTMAPPAKWSSDRIGQIGDSARCASVGASAVKQQLGGDGHAADHSD